MDFSVYEISTKNSIVFGELVLRAEMMFFSDSGLIGFLWICILRIDNYFDRRKVFEWGGGGVV